MPIASVIVRAFNEEDHIGRLLTGIMEQSIQDIEVILVDSGSTDATVAIASRFPVEVVHIDPAEFTFGRSLNLGCSRATGEILVAASAHVYPVYRDWLACLLDPFKDERVALTYGKQRGAGSTKFSEHQILRSWFPDVSDPDQSHPFANNANAAVRRVLWEQHSYDETLTGLEDLEWAQWALDQGYRIAYRADAEVIHVHDETPDEILNRYRREAMALKRLFPHERMSLGQMVALIVRNVVSDLAAAVRNGRLAAEAADIVRFRVLQFLGAYQGLRHSSPVTAELRRTFYYPPEYEELQTDRNSGRTPVDYGGAEWHGAPDA